MKESNRFYHLIDLKTGEYLRINITDWDNALKIKKQLENKNPGCLIHLCDSEKRLSK